MGGVQYREQMPRHALEVIGEITVVSAYLEAELTRLIAYIASPDHTQPVEYLVHSDSLSAKLDRLRILSADMEFAGHTMRSSVTAMWPDPLRERVKEVAKLVADGRPQRNRIVHTQWSVRSDDEFSYLSMDSEGRTKMRYRQEEWSQERLVEVLADLHNARRECVRVYAELWHHRNDTI